jgi:hypothetical protein
MLPVRVHRPNKHLKGTVQQTFDPWFLHTLPTPLPLIIQLASFRFFFECFLIEVYSNFQYCIQEGVTKRCRLSWLINSALVCEPMASGWGEGWGVARSQPMSTGVHMEPK